MSGKVITVSVAVGDVVSRGKVLLTLEAMKLQSPVESPLSGTVSAVRVSPDEQVQSGMVLFTVEPDPAG
jgi:biotin carboxyl carrier protein